VKAAAAKKIARHHLESANHCDYIQAKPPNACRTGHFADVLGHFTDGLVTSVTRNASTSRLMLLFKKKFLPAIRAGEKTQTIRLWKFRHMRAGQRSYIPGVGHIRITAVEPVEIDSLTDADAIPDGFLSASALQHELRSIYGEKLANGHQAFRICFETVTETPPAS
jgi:uncharacterized protein YqfB (UPF0267 family)